MSFFISSPSSGFSLSRTQSIILYIYWINISNSTNFVSSYIFGFYFINGTSRRLWPHNKKRIHHKLSKSLITCTIIIRDSLFECLPQFNSALNAGSGRHNEFSVFTTMEQKIAYQIKIRFEIFVCIKHWPDYCVYDVRCAICDMR